VRVDLESERLGSAQVDSGVDGEVEGHKRCEEINN